MKFSFKLSKDIPVAMALVKKAMKEHKGSFSGNEQAGTVEVKGIKGNYVISGNTATVIVSKKPVLLSDAKIKEEIINFFG